MGCWSLGRVTLPAGVTFCHVNVSRWGNPPTRVGSCYRNVRAKSEPTTKRSPYWNCNNMSQSRRYQCGELFRRVHLPSVERRNQDGNQEEFEDIQISSDALSESPIEAHATSIPRDQSITQHAQSKRNASDVSANENHGAKKKNILRTRPGQPIKSNFFCVTHYFLIACKRELFFDHSWGGYLTYPGSPTSM